MTYVTRILVVMALASLPFAATASAQDKSAELLEAAQQNPNDVTALNAYFSAAFQGVSIGMRDDLDGAAERLDALAESLKTLEPAEKPAKDLLERAVAAIETYRGRIETTRKRNELVGKDAIALNVEAWVNGEPITEESLKGKVVLLDFWAVWCGPCIATFPHLREWQEKYSDDGLVIIGLTRYYNMSWNEDTGRPVRGEEVSPEDENTMLVKFAESHDLHHVFGVQSDTTVSDFYKVTGIPQAVLIDREGKVSLIRVGSGEQNAKDLEEMIEKLIGEGS